jgi:hypothetical protein
VKARNRAPVTTPAARTGMAPAESIPLMGDGVSLGRTPRRPLAPPAAVATDRSIAWEQAWLTLVSERVALAKTLSSLRDLERQIQKRGPSLAEANELRRLRSLVSTGHTALAHARQVLTNATVRRNTGSHA